MSEQALLAMLKSLKLDITDLRVEIRELTNKNGDRITQLEQWRWKWVGAFAALAFVIDLALKLLMGTK